MLGGSFLLGITSGSGSKKKLELSGSGFFSLVKFRQKEKFKIENSRKVTLKVF